MLIGVITHLFPLSGEVYRGQATYETIRALRAHADVQVLYPQAVYPGEHCSARDYNWEGLPVSDVPYRAIPYLSRPFNGDRCARAIYPRLKNMGCDVILAHWIYPEGYAGVKLAKAIDRPAVVFSRGSDLLRISGPVAHRHTRAALRNADYVLTVSENLRQRALQLGATPERSRTILNGCDRGIFHYGDRAAARRLLKLPDDAEIILYVGRMVSDKGVQDLLAAFAVLAGERSNLHLAFIGPGPFEHRVRRFAAAHRLEARIHTYGSQNPPFVASAMQAADLFCLPTYSEGCPNVVIEAISCGSPVVATHVGGVPELLTPDCGIMVPPRDQKRLAEALRSGLERSWDRLKISRAYARTWKDVAAETYDVCREVARPAPPVRKRRAAPVKVTVVTPYFPTSAESYRGHSAFHTLTYLKEFADVEVICPLTSYAGLHQFRTYKPQDLSYRPPGIPTTYFEYPAIPLLTRPFNAAVCERYLEPYLAKSRPDVILNYWLYPEGLAAVRAGHAMGVPVVVGSIGSDLRRIPDPISRRLVKRTLTDADRIITVSDELRRRAIALGTEPEKVVSILNGCDTAIFHPGPREQARRAASAADDHELILYVGSLLESKGLYELTKAFSSIARSRPNARLVFIGEGPARKGIVNKSDAAGILGRVMMLGRQPSTTVADWLRAANVFCLPSHSEGCPNVIVEALACACPVVATDVGGIPELVKEGCGILVPPHDPEALAKALETALSRNWDYEAIGRISRRGWKQVAEETFAVCSAALERSQIGSPVLCAHPE